MHNDTVDRSHCFIQAHSLLVYLSSLRSSVAFHHSFLEAISWYKGSENSYVWCHNYSAIISIHWPKSFTFLKYFFLIYFGKTNNPTMKYSVFISNTKHTAKLHKAKLSEHLLSINTNSSTYTRQLIKSMKNICWFTYVMLKILQPYKSKHVNIQKAQCYEWVKMVHFNLKNKVQRSNYMQDVAVLHGFSTYCSLSPKSVNYASPSNLSRHGRWIGKCLWKVENQC